MATFYQTLKARFPDLSALGLEDRGPDGGYFCTPVGARCIGWPGVDGIHFCFIRGHREMVFAVSPMNLPGEYVHPIARTFREFVRLLLACDSAALEQLWAWDRETFEAFVRSNPPSPEAGELLERIAAEFWLKPMEDPYGYVRQLQQEFDCGSLAFPPEYDEAVELALAERPWAVYFSGAMLGDRDAGEQPGREVAMDYCFDWEGQSWRLLSVYICEDGLAGDFAVEVDPAAEEAFLRKWMPLLEQGLTDDREELLQLENPFVLDARVFARINGEDCRNFHGAQDLWNPCTITQEGRDREAGRWLEHYGCSADRGWIFLRSFWRHNWAGRPLQSLALTLREADARIPGPGFEAAAGTRVPFTRPATGQMHVLIVDEEPVSHTMEAREYNGMILPDQYRLLAYRVEPELPRGVLTVQDTCGGDPPRYLEPRPGEFAACIGIIGGADGPTAVFFTHPGEEKRQAAVSSLYFELPEKTRWRMVFREARRSEKEVVIL